MGTGSLLIGIERVCQTAGDVAGVGAVEFEAVRPYDGLDCWWTIELACGQTGYRPEGNRTTP